MATPKEHIEEIRRKKFSIGGEVNPLTEELHLTVKMLSAELYAKDVHFLMELIQNAEDNEYPSGVNPSLEFVITSRDITGTGAAATLLMFNNEKGFSASNINSICSVAKSTKKGNRNRGYIGEKGIGFKSVFLITSRPYIFSNGYQICFNEDPCSHCNLGYMVPEWVEENPIFSKIQKIYGSGSTLPTTTLILPLKADKVNAVKQQLSSVQPEVLLFLTKIKRLSVREHNKNPNLNTVSAIAITSETNFVKRKNIDAESSMLHLPAQGDKFDNECRCSYYMWKQKFPVNKKNKVERRMEVDEWVITLAFPFGERLQRGTTSPDFLLSSSRETILFDDKWNKEILRRVPYAFVNALTSLVKQTEDAPVSSLPPMYMFRFLPITSSPFPQLNAVRENIKAKLVEENIIPSESYLKQKFFHKPREMGRLMPAFWNILEKAKAQGVNLDNLSNHGICVLSSSFDKEEYDEVLNFLGVGQVSNDWYGRFIQSSDLVMGVSEDVYLELLLFLADNWLSKFSWIDFKNIPLIKYIDLDGKVALCSINDNKQRVVRCLLCHDSWLIDWNREFQCVTNYFFMPQNTYITIQSCSKKETLRNWMKVRVMDVEVSEYAAVLYDKLNDNRKLVVAYAHFLFHSYSRKYLSAREVESLCLKMPLVDNYGQSSTTRNKILIPANGSKWVELIGSNPWTNEGYIELGEDYLQPGNFAGQTTTRDQLMEFLRTYVQASDIPDIIPPNAGIPTLSSPLTKQNAFLLLDWIRRLKISRIGIPQRFLNCIKEGSWLRVTMNGSSSYRPPAQSFYLNDALGKILQNESVLVDIPLVDPSFYGNSILEYKEELRTIGVMFEYAEACSFIGKCLMSLAASSNLTKGTLFSILNFIKFLRENVLPLDSFIRSIKDERWLKTSQGYMSPLRSILFCQEWKVASQISSIPFIDQDHYGVEILSFKTELQLLGVVVGFNDNYQLVAEHLKMPPSCPLTPKATLLVLACIRHCPKSTDKFVKALQHLKCLKTDSGFKSPVECFLFDPEWGCLLQVFSGIPILDQKFYGSTILDYKVELKKLGVLADFEESVKAFSDLFKQRKDMGESSNAAANRGRFSPSDGQGQAKATADQGKWLWTRLGSHRSPSECILFGPEWESISPITVLPFIDDSDAHYGRAIHGYEKELKSMGVVIKLEDGVKFVADSLCFPSNPYRITHVNALSLLKCIRILQEKGHSFPESFSRKASQKWLKTNAGAGYRSPDQCCLFDTEWKQYLKPTDGPFINEIFYGSEINSFRKELNAVGVIVEVGKVCSFLANHLDSHSNLATITRIYNFLAKFKWEADAEAGRRIWIPDGHKKGQWVNPTECVLHDKDDLFSTQFYVLDKHYGRKLLEFFASAFAVKSIPTVGDFCKFWKVWESSEHKLSNGECCAFWVCVMKHWSSKTEKLLADCLVKLPVDSGSDGILLFDRRDVFIADDLLLKDAFEQSSCGSIFVWYPQPSLLALPRTKLLEIFSKIGVRTISESVQKQELSLEEGVEFKQVKPRDIYIDKALAKLILGFLGNPALKLEAAKRYEAVKCLQNLSVQETEEPIEERYSLSLTSGKIVNVRVSQMVRWDRESSILFTQRLDRSNLLEYATHFSEVISKGVLWEMEDHINALAELIRLAFLLEFNEEAVGFLMKSKNLQIFMEDEKFLSATFPSEQSRHTDNALYESQQFPVTDDDHLVCGLIK
ncbi:hypothetical protein EZV62_006998 [Acer yangbiense]|uniref:Sacsin/Nov domain-containing protein n=1 Tax=Acer yangbiense TaxID=1000413 RepID=A0A5C7I822_9ROSI|nr:hypothetical protein EZV62_006998 [Acer yangbiense]